MLILSESVYKCILTTANFLFQWIEVWVELWVNTYIVKMKDTFSLGILPSLIHYTLKNCFLK